MVEGLAKFLQPTYDDTGDTLFQMENATIQSTQILSQLVQQMQQMKTLMVQMHTQLKKTTKLVEMKISLVMETRVIRSHFGEISTAAIMVHEITKGVLVAQRQKATNTQQHSIKNSTGSIEIVTIVKQKKCLEVWDRQ